MRFEVNIAIGGDSLANDECGAGELARILQVTAFAVVEGRLTEVGDEAQLLDMNQSLVGIARLVPDWSVGEDVWVTTREGALLDGRIERVGASLSGYTEVACRYVRSHEMLSSVVVDHFGLDHKGRPVLARRTS